MPRNDAEHAYATQKPQPQPREPQPHGRIKKGTAPTPLFLYRQKLHKTTKNQLIIATKTHMTSR
jgi:hypothetical protein